MLNIINIAIPASARRFALNKRSSTFSIPMGSRVKRKKTSKMPSAGSRYSHTRSDWLMATVTCILLAGVVWIAFGQTLHHEFVNYDDGSYVYTNPRITSGLTLDNAKWALFISALATGIPSRQSRTCWIASFMDSSPGNIILPTFYFTLRQLSFCF